MSAKSAARIALVSPLPALAVGGALSVLAYFAFFSREFSPSIADTLKIVCYVTLVIHVFEGAYAVALCIRSALIGMRAPAVLAFWFVQTFVFGFLSLGRLRRVLNAAKKTSS